MDSQGSEISVKIRSAIKAKLVELGAYVDEELPDYVMVMIANKKSKQQMTDDLQLFLGKHSDAFTTWLHGVLERLQSISSSIKEELRPQSNMDKNRKSPAKTSKLSAHADSKRKYVSRRDSSSGSSESESSDIATRQKQSDRHSRNHHNSKEKNSLSSVRNPHSSDAHRHGEKHSLRGDKKTTKRKSNRSSSESLSHGEITRKPPVRSIPAKPTSKKPSDPQNGANVEPPVKPIKAQPELKLMDNHSDMDQNEDVLDIHADSYQALSEAYISEPDEASLEKENLKDKRSHPRIEPPTNVVRPLKRSPAPEERPQRLSRSVVAQVVNRDSIPEDEYDPTRPQIGTVASVIKVSGRKMALSKDMSAKPNLFLKAIKQANDSVVKRPRKSDEKEKSEREPLELYTKKRRLMDNVEKSHREARVKEVKPLRMKEEKRRRTPEKTPSNEEEKSKRRFEDKKNVEQETEGEKMTSRPVLLRRKFDTRRIEQKNEVADEEMLVVDQSIMTTTRFVVTLTGTGEELKPISISTRTAVVQQNDQQSISGRLTMNGSTYSSPNQSITPDLVIPQAQTLRIDLSDDEDDAMEDSVTNGQLMDMGNDGDLGDSPTRAAPLISPQSAERCRYYPGCIQGEKCPFFHPTFPCKAFPSCSFGDKCRFIHPSCKFDGHCKNPSCPYAHSSPKQKPNFNKKSSVPCHYGDACRNASCPFKHSRPCMYGDSCMKPGCTYYHPKVPAKKTDVAKFRWVSSKSSTPSTTGAQPRPQQTVG